MSDSPFRRALRPESLTAVGIVLVAAALLVPAFDLRPISALLPVAMLVALIALSLAMLILDQRKARAGEAPAVMAKSPGRVAGAFALIVLYALAVDFVGFYPATAVSVPLVAWLFGCRSPVTLIVATVVVVAGIWLIFSFAMAQDFPAGRFWTGR